MIELPDRWITDSSPSGRFPHYTRANADEIAPDPVSPLGWTLLYQGALLEGSVNSWVQFGVFDEGEVDPNDKFGCFGGYLYNALSITWMLGVRMGAAPDVVDHMFYGDNPDGPRYEPHPDDFSPRHTRQLREKAEWVIRQRGEIAATATMRQTTDEVQRHRPDFDTIDDRSLIRYVEGLLPLVSAAFTGHGTVSLGTSVAVGRLRDLLAGQQLSHLTMPLMSGLGGVESAGPTLAMWDLATSATAGGLVDALEAGEDGLASLRKGGPEAVAWADRFDVFIDRYGARGQCEYDLITPSWETRPALALGAIASMSRQGIDRSSALAQSRARGVRDAAMGEARSALSGFPARLAEFEQVLTAATVFMTAREAAKFPFVRMTNEVRVGVVALGRRLRTRGALEEPHDVSILLRSELEQAMDSPKLAADIIAERKPKFEALFGLDPPYIVTNAAPPLSEWPRRQADDAHQAGPGTVLSGIAASPGTVTGKVRILRSAGDSHLLERGDVLVASTTDAGWTPLLMVAGATVIEVGAIGSHGAIVSRELGIPSVVNCPQACSLLEDGTKVQVDGSAGTVTVLAD